MGRKILKYYQAIEELGHILDGLESENIDVDELSIKVKRAVELIRLCKNRIHNTEMEVKKIVGELETELPAEENNETKETRKVDR